MSQEQLGQHISDFIQAKHAAGRKKSTLAFYQNVLTEFSLFAEWPPTPAQVRNYLSHKRATCNEVTLDSIYRGVRAFLNWCEREELLPGLQNPAKRVDAPRRPHRLPKALPLETMQRLFTTIEKNLLADDLAIRDRAMFRLAYDTGARISELAGLLLADLDMKQTGVLIRSGKGDKDRWVFFGCKCEQSLQDWLDIHPGGTRLFLNVLGEPLTRNGIYQALQRWCQRAEIKMTAHQIRHTYATHALRRGIDLVNIQHQLGHADIGTTSIYLAVEDEERRRIHREKAPGDLV